MAIATNQEVQTYSDTQARPGAEALRSLWHRFTNDKASIGDVYEACTQQSPTWVDGRVDGPPHMATPADMLNYNEVITSFLTWAAGEANWNSVMTLCVKPINGS